MRRRLFSVLAGDQGKRLDSFIASKLHWDSALAAKLVRRGAVYLDGARCKEPGRRVVASQTVLAILEERGRSPLEQSAQPAPALRVLFEDEALIVVDKPAGVLTQPSPARAGDSLFDQVAAHLGREPSLVHRLDRETSGIILFAKTRAATTGLAQGFRTGSTSKRYLAATGPHLPEKGQVDLPVAKDPSRVGRYRALKGGAGLPSQTDFIRLFSSPDYCLAALYPRTGRTHQIRAHLAALHAPIAGDQLYGGPRELKGRQLDRCLLHAQALQLAHPLTARPLLVEAPIPEDLNFFFQLAAVEPPAGAWG